MTNLPIIAASAIEVINDEPRVQDTVLAEALGFERPRKIRELIKSQIDVLQGFGDIAPRQGRFGKTNQLATFYMLNEKQALYITAKSNTPKAAEATVEMVEVFAAWRAGHLQPTVSKTEIADANPVLPGMEIVMHEVTELKREVTHIAKAFRYTSKDKKDDVRYPATHGEVGRMREMLKLQHEEITSMQVTLCRVVQMLEDGWKAHNATPAAFLGVVKKEVTDSHAISSDDRLFSMAALLAEETRRRQSAELRLQKYLNDPDAYSAMRATLDTFARLGAPYTGKQEVA